MRARRRRTAQWLCCGVAFALPGLAAGSAVSDPLQACRTVQPDAARLACYDRLSDQSSQPAAETKDNTTGAATAAANGAPDAAAARPPAPPVTAVASASPLLNQRWQLDPDSKTGTFQIVPYRPVYALPVFHISGVNKQPSSPNPDNDSTTPAPYENTEGLFQLSFKTKLWQNVTGNFSDLWFGYTQDSHWQVYDTADSVPFRETDYMPEVIWAFRTGYSILGWHGALASLSLTHQSNGEPNPTSRSWNRIIGTVGLEKDGWVVTLQPWWRVPESASSDNNPDIVNYMGHGALTVTKDWGSNQVSLLVRHNFTYGHGAVGLDWAFPLFSRLSGYVQVFNGYGESLIDYNHSGTYVGIGISLINRYPSKNGPEGAN